jgi:putative endopeptidase
MPQSDDYGNYKPIDPANLDTSVDPNIDFYEYSNGGWIRNNPIPPEYSSWSSWNEVIDRNNEKLRLILEQASSHGSASKGSNIQKLGDLYFTAMDTAGINKLGMDPMREDLERIDAVQSMEDFQKVLSYLKTFRNGGIFSFFAGQDDKNSQNVILQFFQGGLGLPDRDYYLKDDESSKKLRAQYMEYMTNMFKLMGSDEMTSADAARKVMEIEMRLARASMNRVESRDAEATYNFMKLEDLKSLTPDFSWDILFDELGINDKINFDNGVVVGQPDFFKEFNRMITDVDIEDWKNYLRWNLVRWSADKLSSDFENESFNFNNKILRGVEEQRERWKTSLSFVNSAMGEPLGQIFAENNFTPETKAKALEMVENIKQSFAERIMINDWMSAETKAEALKKLGKFDVNIGYTDEWKDYSGLDIDRSSFYGNMKKATAYSQKLNLDKLAKPVNMKEWFMLPQTVNASYSGSRNSITFPAGIMQPPFFDPDADDAVNYGGIGAVIGHELTHGFDDQGRKYDGDGNMRDWWTEQDAKNFKERADKLVEQYNSFEVMDSLHVNGKLSLGENIADLGGLIISYHAFKKTLQDKDLLLIDGFTPEQRFFLAYSQIWKRNQRPESLRLQVNTGPHSPGKFRVNGVVPNMVEFMEAFDGKPGDPMVNDSDNRVVIW